MSILVFDSGIGGLSVLREARVLMPQKKYVYVADDAAFPYGDHDDLVDSMTQAVMRFRQGGLIQHPEDYQDEPLPQKQRTYY